MMNKKSEFNTHSFFVYNTKESDNMEEYHITNEVVIYNDMSRGWSQGKYQPSWHRKVYHMWRDTWRRVYGNVYWFGSLIHPPFKYLSNYVEWIEGQPRFEEFCATCNTTRWTVDKDSKYPGNKDYYPEYMTLMPQSENSIERINRRGSPTIRPKQAVLGIPLDDANKIILTIARQDVFNYGFKPSHVGDCLTKRYKTHKGYKWYRVNYRHNKKYRVKESR